jgi:hypothetical protein
MNAFSARVFAVLSSYTAFPWPIMVSQCKRCNVDPGQLTPIALKSVIPHLATGVARFTSPQKGDLVKAELEALVR